MSALEKYLDDYVDLLVERQEKKGNLLFSRAEYYNLLRPVITVISEHEDDTIEELRIKLYEQSGIFEMLKKFVYQKEMTPGMVIRTGDGIYDEIYVLGDKKQVQLDDRGNIVPSIEKMSEDTIFDLASLTKIYTALSILKLVQIGQLDLSKPLKYYVPEFINLGDMTIEELLSFKGNLSTDSRIDRVTTKEEMDRVIFNMRCDKNIVNPRPYTDMNPIVLKYVIERVSKMDYYSFLKKYILDPLKMENTYVFVPKYKLDRVASSQFDYKYYKDGNVQYSTYGNGIVNDPKAQKMLELDGSLPGHAGLFSTVGDMTILARSMIDGKVIDSKYVNSMGINRNHFSGELPENYQTLGYLCYTKNPILYNNEVFWALSHTSFASAGYTGNQITIDPINQLYFTLLSNRTHNRVVYVDSAKEDEIKTLDSGKKEIILPGNIRKTISKNFAWDRMDEVIYPIIGLTIQYKMLDDFFKLKSLDLKSEQSITIRHI